LIPPYPYYELDPDEFEVVSDFDKLWFARLRLLFRVTVQPRGSSSDRDQLEVLSLAFITTFDDDIGQMIRERDTLLRDHDCKILFEAPESKPICYVVPISNILGRAPLMPCYLNGNPTPTIPHTFAHLRQPRYKARGIIPDTKLGSGNGSKLFRLNMFLWSIWTKFTTSLRARKFRRRVRGAKETNTRRCKEKSFSNKKKESGSCCRLGKRASAFEKEINNLLMSYLINE
jgi:hypothetical protein